MVRFLRPVRLVRSGSATWLIDQSWPVAAVLGDDGSMSLVGWQGLQGCVAPDGELDIEADGVGVVLGYRGTAPGNWSADRTD
jgi:hypothetical protein